MKKSHRGLALLAVLWMIVLLTAIVAGGIHAVRMEGAAALNRVALERGRWAAEACLAAAVSRLDSLQRARAPFDPPQPDSMRLPNRARCASWASSATGDTEQVVGTPAILLTATGRDSALAATSFIELLVVPVGNRVGVVRRRQW